MDILNLLDKVIRDAALKTFGFVDPKGFVEPTKTFAHGDFASNIAMSAARRTGRSPRLIAEALLPYLTDHPYIKHAQVDGPGFINMTLSEQMWLSMIKHINTVGTKYGESDFGKGEKINLEYVSANPTGPVHIGHLRGAVVGDVLSQILKKIGFDVTEEYYINDAGSQIDTLAQSVLLRYRQAMGEDIGDIPEGMYPGEYLIAVGQMLRQKFGDTLTEGDLPAIKKFATDAMMANIKEDLNKLSVHHDVFTSENTIYNSAIFNQVVDKLWLKNLIYEDTLEKPKGKVNDDWVARKQLLFRSSNFGDSADRPLTKTDGSPTYFAVDIAYQYAKAQQGYKKLILILGKDHVGYATRIKCAIESICDIEVEVLFYDLVKLIHQDRIIKMSKRSGNFVTAQDVLQTIGSDAIRFFMLSRSSDVVLDFDLEKATETTKDNPVFYVQYARARGCSVLRKAKESIGNIDFNIIDVSLLKTDEERMLLRCMAEWPSVLQIAAQKREPHRIVFYLQNLAKAFHTLWNAGTDDESMRFITTRSDLTNTRLALIQTMIHVLTSGLMLMKVKPVDSM